MKTNALFLAMISMLIITTACGAPKAWETQSSQSTVSIDLTPHEINDNKLAVDIVVNTHSVNLSQIDFRTSVLLSYGGYSVRPTRVPTLSGHHSTGILEFPIDNDQNSFTITILNVPDIPERTLKWSR